MLRKVLNYTFAIALVVLVACALSIPATSLARTSSRPAQVSGVKATLQGHTLTVKWKKHVKKTSGFSVQYAKTKSFKHAKKKTIKKKTARKAVFKNVKGKKLFVRVRAYRKSHGKKVYSKARVVRVKVNSGKGGSQAATGGAGDTKDSTGYSSEDTTTVPSDGTTLIVYFSATGNTRTVARRLQQATGADLVEITPSQAYTSADLDWTDSSSRVCREHDDATMRPAISNTIDNFATYTTVYIGYPIWWNEAPRIMSTFVETYDLTGKTIVPFCTSSSSSISNSQVKLKAVADAAGHRGTWLGGSRFTTSATVDELRTWASTAKTTLS